MRRRARTVPRWTIGSCRVSSRTTRDGDKYAKLGARWMPGRWGPMKGAGWRRNASGSGSHAMSRGYPNGAIRRMRGPSPAAEHIGRTGGTGGTETSHVPRGRERMRGVAASETRAAQTAPAEWSVDLCGRGVVRPIWGPDGSPRRVTNSTASRAPLERAAGAGDSPVGERCGARDWCVSTAGHVQSGGKRGRPRSKAKYPHRPIAQSTARER
jgi:hypothetical protein